MALTVFLHCILTICTLSNMFAEAHMASLGTDVSAEEGGLPPRCVFDALALEAGVAARQRPRRAWATVQAAAAVRRPAPLSPRTALALQLGRRARLPERPPRPEAQQTPDQACLRASEVLFNALALDIGGATRGLPERRSGPPSVRRRRKMLEAAALAERMKVLEAAAAADALLGQRDMDEDRSETVTTRTTSGSLTAVGSAGSAPSTPGGALLGGLLL
ncbi:unnamed protein product [Prorocentrum cordatum]|uniref:Uncharacterized protein n=1 Tax=Prorocentrum cordatum TaxID=2364126 RepID=A0ABN9Q0M2_9DINO|nr:unnamed protein product [Polarella glacialis]